MSVRSKAIAAAALLAIVGPHEDADAFVHPSPPITLSSRQATQRLNPQGYSRGRQLNMIWNPFATADASDTKKDVSKMKTREMREELESYGMSANSFFDKKELVDALVQARKDGKTPVTNEEKRSTTFNTERTASIDTGRARTVDKSAANRHDRIQAEMEECNKMSNGELKAELESYGVDSKGLYEKWEFVLAIAEARVDGVRKKTDNETRSSSAGKSDGAREMKEEPYDPSYRDVVVRKLEDGMKALLLSDGIIDVTARSDFQ